MRDPGADVDVRRILVISRGPSARRLIARYRSRGIETVLGFVEADAEAPFVDEADYDAFLGSDPFDPVRIVEAAMDAGCDAVHPGTGPAARSLDLYAAAAPANLMVIGLDPRRSAEVLDIRRLIARARTTGLAVPPAESVPPDDDGIEAAARVGLPLRVIPAQGVGVEGWVENFDALDAELEAARGGVGHAVLMHDVSGHPRLEVVVVGDKDGVVSLGVLEIRGPLAAYPAQEGAALVGPALALARGVGLIGIGTVRFEIGADGSAWWTDLLPHAPPTAALVEAVQGIDLVEAELLAAAGQRLGWSAADAEAPSRHGLSAVISASPTTGGTVARVVLPTGDGVAAIAAADDGTTLPGGEASVIVEIGCVAEDREAARIALSAALARTRIDGVATDLDQVAQLVSGSSPGP